MITENGSIVTEFTITEDTQKKYSHKLFIISLIALLIGSAGIVAYIVLGTIYDEKWCDALLVFAVPFAFGLVFVLAIRSNIKASKKNIGVVNSYEFFADCLIAREFRGSEQTGVVRIAYPQIVKTRETEEFFYFYYLTKIIAYPVDKSTLTETELNTIKKLLRCNLHENAEIAELSNSPEAEVKLPSQN